jgi:molybdate transport system substrate-binding protein
MRTRLAPLLLLPLLAGCGRGRSDLTVSAASSLQGAFTEYAKQSFPGVEVRQSFAGSDQLAAQIRAGARPDVFASASTDYPAQLFRQGLVERPKTFAGNRLVIAVQPDSEIHSLSGLTRPGTTIVTGDNTVPVGSYTREVLGRLPASERTEILANVRSEEPEVSSIVAKLTQGAADAGFVYRTDVRAVGADLRTIRIPAGLQPSVAYAIAVVKGADDPGLARRFVAGVIRGHGAADLRAAGFLPPP